MRSYSIMENPFIYGIEHIPFGDTEGCCGFPIVEIRAYRAYECPLNAPPFNQLEKAAYYAGRAIRFLVSVPGTLVDLVLQILQSLSTTLEYLLVKGESVLRGCAANQTFSMKLCHHFSLTQLFVEIRNWTTIFEPRYLANDLGLIKDVEAYSSLSSIYRNFLFNKLFPCKIDMYWA